MTFLHFPTIAIIISPTNIIDPSHNYYFYQSLNLTSVLFFFFLYLSFSIRASPPPFLFITLLSRELGGYEHHLPDLYCYPPSPTFFCFPFPLLFIRLTFLYPYFVQWPASLIFCFYSYFLLLPFLLIILISYFPLHSHNLSSFSHSSCPLSHTQSYTPFIFYFLLPISLSPWPVYLTSLFPISLPHFSPSPIPLLTSHLIHPSTFLTSAAAKAFATA